MAGHSDIDMDENETWLACIIGSGRADHTVSSIDKSRADGAW
jgi:hypothetical protein